MSQPPPLPPIPSQPPLTAYPTSGPPEYPPDPQDFDDAEPRRRRRRRDDDYDDRDDRDDYDDIDLGRSRRGSRRRNFRKPAARWGTASVGMKMIFGAMIVFTISGALFQAATFGEPPEDAGGPQQQQKVLATFGICFLMLSTVIVFIGGCLCCAAPDRGAHRWALAAVIVSVVAMFAAFAGGIVIGVGMAHANRNGGGNNPVNLGNNPAFIAVIVSVLLVCAVSFVFTMLFHAAVARTLGNGVLLHQSYWFIAAPIAQGVLGLALSTIAKARADGGNEPGHFGYAMLSLFQIAMTLLVYGWYVSIAWQTFRTMDIADRKRLD
jgi:heme/copper-type cytochrome/quinol oxidase subunit 2